MSLPGGFCQDCFKGTLRGDVVPSGSVETIHGLPTYVARPDAGHEPLGLVVIITDAFGWELRNTRALADAYARRVPCVVYVPDFMDDAAPPATDLALCDKIMAPAPDWYTALVLKPWWTLTVASHFSKLVYRIRTSVTRPRVRAFFEAVRDSAAPPPELAARGADFKVGVAGFCWGGRYCVELCGEPERQPSAATSPPSRELVHCGFTAHPSQVKIPGDVEKVRVPLSVANGDNDSWMGREKMATLRGILEGREPAVHEVVVYDGATHGFAVRGDPNDPRQAELGLKAEDQAVGWFRTQFSHK